MLGGPNDRTALVLGALATVFGWQSARITEEIRSTTSVAYSTEKNLFTPGTQTLIIENVSKNKSIKNVEFMLSCPDALKQCIKRGSVNNRLFPPTIAPSRQTVNPVEHSLDELIQQVKGQQRLGLLESNMPREEFDRQVTILSDREKTQPVESISITATIAAGGKLGIDYELIDPKSQPEFFFIPDKENPIDIFVFEGYSFRGYIVRNYFEIVYTFMIATFTAVLLAVLTLAWMRLGGIGAIRRWLGGRKQANNDSQVENPAE